MNKSTILEEAVKILCCRNERKKTSAASYNIFSVLQMERKEVSTHSAFLFSLINKEELHGYGEAFLFSFIKKVLKITVDANDSVYVQREYPFAYGRIDFLITIGGNRYPIEMKIDAGEQPLQLQRYYDFTNNDVYYLTLDSRPPTSCEIETKKRIKSISFKNEIVTWLDVIVQMINGDTEKDIALKVLINQYKSLLLKLTKEFKAEEEIMNLIKSKNEYEAINELVEAQKAFQKLFLQNFFAEMENGLKFIENYCDKPIREDENAVDNYYEEKTWPHLLYRFKLHNGLGLTDNHYLYYGVEIDHNLYTFVAIREANGNQLQEFPKEYFKIIESLYDEVNKKKNYLASISWDYITVDKKQINFKRPNDAWLSLLSDDISKSFFNKKQISKIIDEIRHDFENECSVLKKYLAK